MVEIDVSEFDGGAFDFDGIIADTNPAHLAARETAATELAVELDIPELAKIPHAIHKQAQLEAVTPPTIILWALINGGVLPEDATEEDPLLLQVIARKHEVYDREGIHSAVEVPGVAPFIGKLAVRLPGKMGIVSGARLTEVYTFFENHKYGNIHRYFGSKIITHENGAQPKPSPESYEMMMELLGITKPERMLVFEDAPLGIEAGNKAGATTIALPTTQKIKVLLGLKGHQAPDFVFKDYQELAQAFGFAV